MTEEQLELGILGVSNRFNSILYDSPNMYSDNLKNLSDLKLKYGRMNGEKWVNNFTYLAGEIVSFEQDIFISLLNNNLNKETNNETYWKKIYSSNLQKGKYFAAAFCNLTMYNNYLITLSNNYNISSATFQTFGGVISGIHFIELKFKESANITNDQYLVFPLISRTKGVLSDPDNSKYSSWYKQQQIQLFNKTKTGFTIATEFYNNRELSFVIIPKQF